MEEIKIPYDPRLDGVDLTTGVVDEKRMFLYHLLSKVKEKAYNIGPSNLELGCGFGGKILTMSVVSIPDLEAIIKELTGEK